MIRSNSVLSPRRFEYFKENNSCLHPSIGITHLQNHFIKSFPLLSKGFSSFIKVQWPELYTTTKLIMNRRAAQQKDHQAAAKPWQQACLTHPTTMNPTCRGKPPSPALACPQGPVNRKGGWRESAMVDARTKDQ